MDAAAASFELQKFVPDLLKIKCAGFGLLFCVWATVEAECVPFLQNLEDELVI